MYLHISMSLSFHLIRMDYELYFYVVWNTCISQSVSFMQHAGEHSEHRAHDYYVHLCALLVRLSSAGGSYVVRFALIFIKRLHFLFSATTHFAHLLKPSASISSTRFYFFAYFNAQPSNMLGVCVQGVFRFVWTDKFKHAQHNSGMLIETDFLIS